MQMDSLKGRDKPNPLPSPLDKPSRKPSRKPSEATVRVPTCCCYRCELPRDNEATVRLARQRAEGYRAELLRLRSDLQPGQWFEDAGPDAWKLPPESRPELSRLMGLVGSGDVAVVPTIPQARLTARGLLSVLENLARRGAALHVADLAVNLHEFRVAWPAIRSMLQRHRLPLAVRESMYSNELGRR